MWDRHILDGPRTGVGGACDRSRGAHNGLGDRNREDTRDVFTRELDLPRDGNSELVRERERFYEINGDESRILATVGAFRVVPESDLLRMREGAGNVRRSLQHLENGGLVRRGRLSPDDRVVTLTDRGRDLLEANRRERPEGAREPRQAFYAGLRKPRELNHDAKIDRAYQRAEARLRGDGLSRSRRRRGWPRRRRPADPASPPCRGATSMTLPTAASKWTIEEANAVRLAAIAAFGFTERQAGFLLQVLLHAGVFVERQYCSHAGIVHGQKSTDFIKGLVERRFATPIATGKLHRGRMFHVHYKPLWDGHRRARQPAPEAERAGADDRAGHGARCRPG